MQKKFKNLILYKQYDYISIFNNKNNFEYLDFIIVNILIYI